MCGCGTDKLLEKDVGKQRITQEQASSTRQRLTTTTKMEDLGDVDFVIEAVPVRWHKRRSSCKTHEGS